MLSINKSHIPNAGRGVFANKDYKKGDYVCFYDGIDKDRKIFSNTNYEFAMANPFVPGFIRFGFKDTIHSEGIGQIINDSQMFVFQESKKNDKGLFSLRAIQPTIQLYETESTNNANVIFHEDIPFKLVAKRDILSGEELYLSYGLNYWLSHILSTTEYPFIRLVGLLLNKRLIYKKGNFFVNDIITDPIIIMESILQIKLNGTIISMCGLSHLSPSEKLRELIKLVL